MQSPHEQTGVPRTGKPQKREPFARREIWSDFQEWTPDEAEFMQAMQKFKEDNRKPHPSDCDVLAVARAIGYRKVEDSRRPSAVEDDSGQG